jgi:hypothetical protein
MTAFRGFICLPTRKLQPRRFVLLWKHLLKAEDDKKTCVEMTGRLHDLPSAWRLTARSAGGTDGNPLMFSKRVCCCLILQLSITFYKILRYYCYHRARVPVLYFNPCPHLGSLSYKMSTQDAGSSFGPAQGSAWCGLWTGSFGKPSDY